MIRNDFRNKAVLVTGGTKGLGLSIALAFGKEGAQTYLTYKWGSADMDDVTKAFTDIGAPAPHLIEADVTYKEDTKALFEQIKQNHDSIEVFVSNVSFAQIGGSFESYKKRSFLKSLEYSAWPMMGYTERQADPDPNRAIKEAFFKKASSVWRLPNSFFSNEQRHKASALIADAEDAIPAECGKELEESISKSSCAKKGK